MLLVSGCLFQLRHLWTGALMNTTKKRPERRLNTGLLAERVGFEPTVPCGTPDFESGTFDHSATSPQRPV